MLAPRSLPLPTQAPTAPDLWLCSPVYGHSISPSECSLLVDYAWQSGDRDVDFYYNGAGPSGSVRLPKRDRLGTCQVAIEPAGPSHRYPPYFRANADKMRGLVGWVIQQCALESGGIGGFVTVGLEATESYLQSRVNDWDDDINNATDGRSSNGAFLTISVNGINETNFTPGDTDPDIAGYLSNYATFLSMLFAEKLNGYQELARLLRDRAVTMIRGGARNWWAAEGSLTSQQQTAQDNKGSVNSPSISDISNLRPTTSDFDAGEMTYQCDGNLGAGGPEPVDCEKLSWSRLSGDVNAEVELQKGVPRFWSEGTCTLALALFPSSSSHIPQTMTITWSHILSAFNTLNNLCVQHPFHTSLGGRAYYGRQRAGSSSWTINSGNANVNGKSKSKGKKKRDSVGGVEGNAALPPGVNVTLFRNAGPGKLSCAWVLAEEGKDVSMCQGG